MKREVKIYVGPKHDGLLEEAVRRGGGTPAALADAEAVVLSDLDPSAWLGIGPNDHVRWVQILSAGVERWFELDAIDDRRVWTSAAGAYAHAVAEHALVLILGLRRRLVECIRVTDWSGPDGTLVEGSTTLIVGCGAIGRALIPMLNALGSDVIAVTRTGAPVIGATKTYATDELPQLWSQADAVVLAAPATDRTAHLVDGAALSSMRDDAIIVNVGRGSLIDTEALVSALKAGEIAGAGLDVTSPEPLPKGHPLWSMPNVIVTPHVANPPSTLRVRLAGRVEENVRRYVAGESLLAAVDLEARY